jgi:mannose-1-phosphate guanylyltransferase
MKALVLCAGLGTRLRPLTERWPKPAIPLLGQPLFRYTLSTLVRAGVREVAINSFHLPAVMEDVAGAECIRKGLSLTVNREVGEIQGTGGGIRGLRHVLKDDLFIVFNGDILFTLDLEDVLRRHQASGASASMVLMPMPEGEKYAAVETDAQLRVRRIAGHGPGGERLSPWHFTGVHVMSPEVFDFMSPAGPEDINREVYPRMIAAGRVVGGLVVQGYWSDLGTPSRYLATQRDLLFGQVPLAPFGEDSPLRAGERHANYWSSNGPQAAKIAGPALIDPSARVHESAWLGTNVWVGPGASVGANAKLNRVAVLDDTEIAPGEFREDTIAWREHRIAAG